MTERPGSGSGGGSGSGSGANPHLTLRTAGPPRLGGVLGRYELLQVLGHGAMATVFRARDTHLGREVAVKVMTLAVAARADSAERFRREAQAVASVKHPGIVEIFDFVAAMETEPAYIVSELINGPTLRKFLDERRGRVLPETAALLALPLAEALHAAHARGVVHRDIKPDNVMLERGGEERRVVLTDFGVAHVTGLETMTATGALVGSPSYMSPEQARGDDVGPGSDLFSFGVLLYEMATGHLPFTGKDPLMILSAISRGIYKRPSQISPFAGPMFDDICMRCLRPTAAERHANAGAIAEELRTLCRAAGLEPAASLRALIDDPDAFEAELRPRMAAAAVAQARRHARRAELARALSELSRATAYVPGHAEATRLIGTISSRRRWFAVAAIGAGVVALGAGISTVAPRVTALFNRGAGVQEGPAVAVNAGLGGSAAAAKASPATPAGPAVAEPPIAGAPAPVATPDKEGAAGTPAVAKAKRKRVAMAPAAGAGAAGVVVDKIPGAGAPDGKGVAGEKPGAGTESATPATRPEAANAADAGSKAAGESAPVATTPTPVPAAVVVPRVTVEIYAANAFCTPSMDDDKQGQVTSSIYAPAIYNNVKAGPHRIYCTTPGGDRLLAGKQNVGPPKGGGAFRIRLRKDGDKPAIDPKTTSEVAELPAPAPPAATPAPPSD